MVKFVILILAVLFYVNGVIAGTDLIVYFICSVQMYVYLIEELISNKKYSFRCLTSLTENGGHIQY